MENAMKIVDFSKCKECKYYEVEDYNEPCHECLNTFEMANSHTPLNFDKRGDDNNELSKYNKKFNYNNTPYYRRKRL